MTPTLSSAARATLDARLLSVNTSIPARVESYDRATQTISAQPLIRVAYLDETETRRVERLPIVTNVPVVYLGGGAYSSAFPLAKGDTVLLLFSQASIDKWLDRGGDVDPLDDRRHALSDAMAIPGLRSRPESLGDDATADDAWVFAGPEIRIGGAVGTEPTLMGEAFLNALSALTAAIETAVGAAGNTQTGGTAIAATFHTAKVAFETLATTYKTAIARVK